MRSVEHDVEQAVSALDLDGAQCIVTGASSGIGMWVAWGLAVAGCRVDMACKSMTKCSSARDTLREQCYYNAVSSRQRGVDEKACDEAWHRCLCVPINLSDSSSIRHFAMLKAFELGQGQQVILVNNAGVMGASYHGVHSGSSVALSDGHLWPNHLGHFLLTVLLLPVMGPRSCVAIVASRAHHQGVVEFDSEGSIKDGGHLHWYYRYARSKLCNILFAAELRRCHNHHIRTIAISPGRVKTAIFHNVPTPLRQVLQAVACLTFRSPQRGAAHILRSISSALSCAEESELPLYWHNGVPTNASEAAHESLSATALWQYSTSVVGL